MFQSEIAYGINLVFLFENLLQKYAYSGRIFEFLEKPAHYNL